MLGRGGQLSIVSIIEKNEKNTAGVPGTPALVPFRRIVVAMFPSCREGVDSSGY